MARKILLADDSVTAQNMGRKILADAGYEVITVNNGSAALKKINEQRPDVIVLDVYMPGYSGLEVCQRLKETGDTARIPILLTVGKLEPFKPEEAKRVRADGFIVKPFEASELLSALTRLEDKIVPRQETSKPGRFSRAMASIEDPRLEKSVPYDKTMAVEEDSSWKNRISFPTKAKKKEANEEPAYEQASKHQPSVIERKPEAAHPVEEKIDLSALAPTGLPKDVTPEEIAALAAAAARIKGKTPEPEMPVVPPPRSQDQKAEEEPFVESARLIPTPPPAVHLEAKAEMQEEPPPAQMRVDQVVADVPETTSLPAASVAEDKESSLPEQEPVTMAAAAAASGSAPSRWMAVSVALSPDETGVSLEQEMQKAYGAYQAAEIGHANSASMIPDTAAEPASLSPSPEVVAEASPAVPAIQAPEEVHPLAAVASLATEAVSAAAKELENVATAFAQPENGNVPAPEATSKSLATEAVMPSEAGQPTTEPLRSEAAPPSEVQPLHETSAFVEPARPPAIEAIHPADLSPTPTQEIATPSGGEPEKQISEAKTESARPESDFSEATAAAWASWKRVQESGSGNGSSSPEAPQPAAAGAEGTAAMAAAVGGKNALEELTAAAESDPAIASIVDSVLADLRPKIVEEISRKLGKKK